MKKYLFYHAQCPDGFGAAWAFNQKFGKTMEYLPAFHGQAIPLLPEGAEVFIADFSFPRAELLELRKKHPITLLDHHISAQKNLEGLDFVIFDMNRSGARISWDFLFPNQVAPLLIQYVEDRDLWKFKLPHSHEIHEYISSVEFDFDAWTKLAQELETNFDKAAQLGAFALKKKKVAIKMLCEESGMVEIAGHRVPCVNTPHLQSEVGHILLDLHPQAPFSASWYCNRKNEIVMSFRSRGDFDVSQLAQSFGGGGHKAASGCTFEKRPQFIVPSSL